MQKIKELIKEYNLVSPGESCSPVEWEERLNLIEGGYLDLTLDAVLQPESARPFLGKTTRKTPIQREIQAMKVNNQLERWVLYQGSYVFKTAETINLPNGFYADLYTRRTAALDEIMLSFAPISAGFKGKLFIKAWVMEDIAIDVERGAAFCAIRFMPVPFDLTLYQGVWGGEKSHTEGYERAK